MNNIEELKMRGPWVTNLKIKENEDEHDGTESSLEMHRVRLHRDGSQTAGSLPGMQESLRI